MARGIEKILGLDRARKALDAMMDHRLWPNLFRLLAVCATALSGGAQLQGPGTVPSLSDLGGASSVLGKCPGTGGGSFSNLPGTGGFLEGEPGPPRPGEFPPRSSARFRLLPRPTSVGDHGPSAGATLTYDGAVVGPLELPSGPEDDGPPDGLTLEQAIDITLERSRDLRAKSYEIPLARPTSSRPACDQIRSSIRTGSFLLIRVTISAGRSRAVRPSLIPTSPSC